MANIERLLNLTVFKRVHTRKQTERLIDARHLFAAQKPSQCKSDRTESGQSDSLQQKSGPIDHIRCNLRDAEAHYMGRSNKTQRPHLHIPGMESRPCIQIAATENAVSTLRSRKIMKRELINQGLMYALVSLFAMIAIPLFRLFTS